MPSLEIKKLTKIPKTNTNGKRKYLLTYVSFSHNLCVSAYNVTWYFTLFNNHLQSLQKHILFQRSSPEGDTFESIYMNT